MEDVCSKLDSQTCDDNINPTLLLPNSPPQNCVDKDCSCQCCQEWWKQYKDTVDTLLFNCNVHKCIQKRGPPTTINNGTEIYRGPKGCIDKDGNCSAQFPHEVHLHSSIDQDEGHC
jgi:hypothetical protein